MDFEDERIKHISTNELKKKIAGKEDFLLVDVNPPDMYEKHHIKGAIFVPYESAGRWFKENKISKEREIVLYCENPMCTASPIVAKKLVMLGYKKVFEYSDGIRGWIAAGGQWEGSG